MRSKAPLAMIEQTVMVLVFALAAALCLQVFVWCDRQSRDSAARDQAVLCAQSAALPRGFDPGPRRPGGQPG